MHLRKIQADAVVPDHFLLAVEVVIMAEFVEQCARVCVIIGVDEHERRVVLRKLGAVARRHAVCAAAEIVQTVAAHILQRLRHGLGEGLGAQRLLQIIKPLA